MSAVWRYLWSKHKFDACSPNCINDNVHHFPLQVRMLGCIGCESLHMMQSMATITWAVRNVKDCWIFLLNQVHVRININQLILLSVNLRRELGDRWTHLCSGWYQWLIQMVGKQRVLVDNVKEGEAGGALRSGKRVKSLWLECTAALRHIHTHTHTLANKQIQKKHIITQLSMVMGAAQKFLEV